MTFQDEPAVPVLRWSDAVRDGKRVVAEETLTLGKVRKKEVYEQNKMFRPAECAHSAELLLLQSDFYLLK